MVWESFLEKKKSILKKAQKKRKQKYFKLEKYKAQKVITDLNTQTTYIIF